jgi:hypothetical protein
MSGKLELFLACMKESRDGSVCRCFYCFTRYTCILEFISSDIRNKVLIYACVCSNNLSLYDQIARWLWNPGGIASGHW